MDQRQAQEILAQECSRRGMNGHAADLRRDTPLTDDYLLAATAAVIRAHDEATLSQCNCANDDGDEQLFGHQKTCPVYSQEQN